MSIVLSLVGGFWEALAQMSPYLLLGFLVAGILSVFVSAETVERHLGGRGLWPALKASLAGVPLPLCSCGVIPVAATLRRHGAGKGATVAFLISTPQTGADSILATYSMLGIVLAVFRPVAAFVSGIVGGWLCDAFGTDEAEATPDPKAGTDACCQAPPGQPAWLRVLHYGFVALPRDLARSLLVGLAVAAAISALIPDGFLAGTLGTGLLPMVLMMLVGIPLYVCATGSIPVAAAMVAKGISPGAALVFLMTGPATNAAAIAIVWKVLGRRTTLVYLGSIAVTALLAGLLLDKVVDPAGVSCMHAGHDMLSPVVANASGVVLVAVLLVALVRRPAPIGDKAPAVAAATDASETVRVRVGGMTCSHCAQSVHTALLACTGVQAVQVDRGAGVALVTGCGLRTEDLRRAVETMGFSCLAVEPGPAAATTQPGA